ncbi:hypothetical protein D3C87_1650060 [compost metagenome]
MLGVDLGHVGIELDVVAVGIAEDEEAVGARSVFADTPVDRHAARRQHGRDLFQLFEGFEAVGEVLDRRIAALWRRRMAGRQLQQGQIVMVLTRA